MIKIIDLHRNFGDLKVLERININIKKEEFVILFGPTGCGKTTLLRIIAGLEKSTMGRIETDGEIGFVFQEPALLPWRNIEKNIEFGLEIKNIERRREIINEYVKLVKLEGFEKYYPNELSTGMKQKVAIAATLAVNPSVLLMDEPFSSLDTLTKRRLQKELIEIWRQTKKTIVFVTHDIEEAVFLADRIIILGNSPTKIIKEFNIKIPRDERKYSGELEKIKKDIIKLLSTPC